MSDASTSPRRAFIRAAVYGGLISATPITAVPPAEAAIDEVLQVACDTAAGWLTANRTLAAGELGYETDTKVLRVGDGNTPWSGLPEFVPRETLSATYGGRVNVAAYGAKGNNITDDTTAINTAIAAARAYGVHHVHFPPGTYKVTAKLNTYSGMTYSGEGMSVTTLKCSSSGSFRCFDDAEGATQATPMTGVSWLDMTIDGSAVQGTASKAFFVQHCQRMNWTRVRATGWPATGFGVDYIQDGAFSDCIADGNGRLLNVGDAGASGFGIGSGSYRVESVVLTGCRAYGNKNYGIFFEQQNDANGNAPHLSKGARVIGCHLTGNSWGIGDSGVDGLVVEGCTIEGNTRDGISVDQGSGGGIGRPGRAGLIVGNIIRGNGRYGVFLDYRFKATSTADSRYAIRGNTIEDNAAVGVQLSTDTATIKDITVAGNSIGNNGANGVQATVLSTGSWKDLVITGNRVNRNGQTNGSGYTQGIRIDGATVRCRITDNDCYDSGVTQRQTHGVKLAAVTHTDMFVVGNDLRGNLTGGLDAIPALTGLPVIRNNRGHNPRGSLAGPPLPASGVAYTNTLGYDCTVFVMGGTVTSINVGTGGGVATGVTSGSMRVPAGQSIYLTYSAAPNWTWFAD